ncbi:MAG: hypothetical protein CM15mP74_00310 [Halieaceae bacterium]|nr:MAG: hypothetical protein CM15mP74_00310 [Halieaceae bacterium]
MTVVTGAITDSGTSFRHWEAIATSGGCALASAIPAQQKSVGLGIEQGVAADQYQLRPALRRPLCLRCSSTVKM